MGNLAELLDTTAETYPERVAIVNGDTTLTYTQLLNQVNKVANLLASRGIGPGDAVALSCPNVPQFTQIYFGILKTGATVVPLNILLTGREVAYHLQDSGAVAYFAHEGSPELPIGSAARAGFDQAEQCAHLVLISEEDSIATEAPTLAGLLDDCDDQFGTVDVGDDDVAVILYTSGTTGQPKGAQLRHRNMRQNALASSTIFDSSADRPDVYLTVLPLFHSFGQTVVQNSAIAFGSMLVMIPRFEPAAALDVMKKNRVTFFAGVPTMYWALLNTVGDLSDAAAIGASLRVAASGGAALPLAVHEDFAERFGVTIMEGYGLSETSPVASFTPWGEPVRVGSIGKPIAGIQMKLINDDWSDTADILQTDGKTVVGEIAIRGHNIMLGYHQRPEATAEVIRDGWFRSGDLARKDADGFFHIVDRSKDMIIRGGYNVYPRELEEVLMTHPAVSLVAVVGVAHHSHGEEIKAFVVPVPGSDTTPDELQAWGKEQFAAYKSPRVYEFVDALPMTSTGKILKRALL